VDSPCSLSAIGSFSLAVHAMRFSRYASAPVCCDARSCGDRISFYVLPYGLGWFIGAVVLTIVGILLILPKW
jgi:hypothetical protein